MNTERAPESTSEREEIECKLNPASFRDPRLRRLLEQAIEDIENKLWTKSLALLRIIFNTLDPADSSETQISTLNSLLGQVLYEKGIAQLDKIPVDPELPFRGSVEQRVTDNKHNPNKKSFCASCNRRLSFQKTKHEIRGHTVYLCVNCNGLLKLESSEHHSQMRERILGAYRYLSAADSFGSSKTSDKLLFLETKASELSLDLPSREHAKLLVDLSTVSELISMSESKALAIQLGSIRALAKKKIGKNTIIPALANCLLKPDPSIRMAASDALDVIDQNWLSNPQVQFLIPKIQQAFLSGNKQVSTQAESLLRRLKPEETGKLKWKKYRKRFVVLSAGLFITGFAIMLVQVAMFFGNDPRTIKRFFDYGLVNIENSLPRLSVGLNSKNIETSEASAEILQEIITSWSGNEVPSQLVEQIKIALQSKSPAVRNYAAKSLAQIGDSANHALPLLVERLQKESDFLVRASIARAIAAIDGSGKTVPELRKAAKHKECDVRKAAIDTLGNIRGNAKQAVPTLIEAMKVNICSYRKSTQRIIGATVSQLATKKSLSILASRIQSPSSLIQESAMNALGKMGSNAKPAVPALINSLRFNNFKLKKVALRTLARLGENASAAIPYLFIYLEDTDAEIRRATKYSLKKIDPDWEELDSSWRSMEELSDVYTFYNKGLRHNHPFSQVLHANALTYMGPTGLPVILSALESEDNFVRQTMLVALQKLAKKSPELIPVDILTKSLADPDAEVRIKCVELIKQLGSKARDLVPNLIDLLNREKYTQLRQQIVEALGRIGPDAAPAVPSLKALIYDPAWNNQTIVIQAIELILNSS